MLNVFNIPKPQTGYVDAFPGFANANTQWIPWEKPSNITMIRIVCIGGGAGGGGAGGGGGTVGSFDPCAGKPDNCIPLCEEVYNKLAKQWDDYLKGVVEEGNKYKEAAQKAYDMAVKNCTNAPLQTDQWKADCVKQASDLLNSRNKLADDALRAEQDKKQAALAAAAKTKEDCIKNCKDDDDVIKQCDETLAKLQADNDKEPEGNQCWRYVKGRSATRPFKCGKRCLSLKIYAWNPVKKDPGAIKECAAKTINGTPSCESASSSQSASIDSILLNGNGIRILSFAGTGTGTGADGGAGDGAGADGSSSSSSNDECDSPTNMVGIKTFKTCTGQDIKITENMGQYKCAEKCTEALATASFSYTVYGPGLMSENACRNCYCAKIKLPKIDLPS